MYIYEDELGNSGDLLINVDMYVPQSYLIKDKLIDLIERAFQREGSHWLACNDRNTFFYFKKP